MFRRSQSTAQQKTGIQYLLERRESRDVGIHRDAMKVLRSLQCIQDQIRRAHQQQDSPPDTHSHRSPQRAVREIKIYALTNQPRDNQSPQVSNQRKSYCSTSNFTNSRQRFSTQQQFFRRQVPSSVINLQLPQQQQNLPPLRRRKSTSRKSQLSLWQVVTFN